MLRFGLNLVWDGEVNKWTIVDTTFGERADDGDTGDITDIHSMNLAMSAVIKIFEVLDTPTVATTINIIPGETTANTLPANVLS